MVGFCRPLFNPAVPPGGKVPSACEADEGGLWNRRGPLAGRRGRRPLRQNRKIPPSRRGGCPHPPAPEDSSTRRGGTLGRPETARWGHRALHKIKRTFGYAVGAGVLTRPPIALTPWCLFGFFLGPQKETRRRGGAPPPINETALSSSPHPSGLRPATFPYPLCRFATSPLDKGSRPPGGRLKSRRRRKPLRFKNQLSCKSCFSSASRFRASMGDKMFTSVIRSLLRTVCPPRSMRETCS